MIHRIFYNLSYNISKCNLYEKCIRIYIDEKAIYNKIKGNITLWRYICIFQIVFTQIAVISFLSWVFAIVYCLFYFIRFDLKSSKTIINKELTLHYIYNKSILELDLVWKTYRIIPQNAIDFSFLPIFFLLLEFSHVLNQAK